MRWRRRRLCSCCQSIVLSRGSKPLLSSQLTHGTVNGRGHIDRRGRAIGRGGGRVRAGTTSDIELVRLGVQDVNVGVVNGSPAEASVSYTQWLYKLHPSEIQEHLINVTLLLTAANPPRSRCGTGCGRCILQQRCRYRTPDPHSMEAMPRSSRCRGKRPPGQCRLRSRLR